MTNEEITDTEWNLRLYWAELFAVGRKYKKAPNYQYMDEVDLKT